jgi:hypothetical protein
MKRQISKPAAGEPIAAGAMHSAADGAAAAHSGLDDLAALLAEQLSACHAAAARCFAIANDEEDFQLPARMDALRLAVKLVQASAQAASAVKRVKGGEFHHRVTVERIDVEAEKAARKAREEAAITSKGDARRKLEERIDRILEAELTRAALEEELESGSAGPESIQERAVQPRARNMGGAS